VVSVGGGVASILTPFSGLSLRWVWLLCFLRVFLDVCKKKKKKTHTHTHQNWIDNIRFLKTSPYPDMPDVSVEKVAVIAMES
jgi:hypothetical protein